MHRRQNAFTVVEMVLAMAITAMIGLSVAGVAVALSTAQADQEESYQYAQTARSAINRIQGYLSRARLVTARGDGSLVYWIKDADGDGTISLEELGEIRRHSEDRTLRLHRVVFPDNMDEQVHAALNAQVELDCAADMASATQLIETNGRHVDQVEAEDVEAFDVAAYPECPVAKLVSIHLVIGQGERQVALRSAVALRADCTDEVAVSEGAYVLNGP